MPKRPFSTIGIISIDPPDGHPQLIHHYTDSRGLYGIIDKSCLWATPVAYLNDTSEFIHARDLALELINGSLTDDGSEYQKFVKHVLIKTVTDLTPAGTFAISFSSQPDILSQWRAYGGKGGYGLGFDFTQLWKLALSSGIQLVQCIYKLETQKAKILELLADIEQHYQVVLGQGHEIEGINRSLQAMFRSRFLHLAGSFKHPLFFEESEWRLIGEFSPFAHAKDGTSIVKILREALSFRPTDTKLVPYYEFKLPASDNLCLREICIGPNIEPELAFVSLKAYLFSKGLESVVINKTNAPLRPNFR